MSIFDKCYNFTRAEEVMEEGIYPYFTPIQEVCGNKVKVDGKEMIMVGSNNYLGLLDHPKVMKAAQEAVDRYGVATCGSRFLNGTLDIHVELEEKLAQFMNKEAGLAFSTGFQTNQGIISTLISRGDAVIADRMVHASIIDACRLSYGDVYKYKHNDMADLERQLSSIDKDVGKLIVVDGVFSMEGDLANLPDIVELAKKYDTQTMVDDAHGIGVMGKNGRGTAEHFGVEDEVDIIMGTFSKSFASLGGMVVGKKKVISYIKHFARSLIFSASITPASVATVLATLDIIQNEPERRKRLWQITEKMKSSLQDMGYDTGPTETPIIPVFIRNDELAFMLWRLLREIGIFTNPIIYPAVPKGEALIRTSYSATHTNEELDTVLEGFEKCGTQLGIIKQRK
ncbi:MAG: aminotransferase class I/II-fold pyridoxal phosphate-dependent enzyme [Candidatus Aminicenantes bacterium]|nr:aminotransferase class I/II-fold pyridoxal phosphate-dependent enzyme [Candidatus Aminicenantes bacterium]MDH5384489.1 aminotransferase class I/II-fold pyridoxal phosphate-dependent enzyme [Candidatus Aminicenantes bacterium]MDH5743171.1 aminotransferase class I/II-fold pyridoxal phosphate-dependent enzyme [Candidatus Aminicenantes bacterium]